MRTVFLTLIAVLCLALAPAQDAAPEGVRFGYVDVFVDTGDMALAAYQVDIAAVGGHVKIVGIEGGEHVAFKQPPYYDPAAMAHERVVIGAFSLGEDLPHGSTRVARVHVQRTGEGGVEWTAVVVAAATVGEKKIGAAVRVMEGAGK